MSKQLRKESDQPNHPVKEELPSNRQPMMPAPPTINVAQLDTPKAEENVRNFRDLQLNLVPLQPVPRDLEEQQSPAVVEERLSPLGQRVVAGNMIGTIGTQHLKSPKLSKFGQMLKQKLARQETKTEMLRN